jgi:carbamoyl-phosphate synthase large subunit
MTNILLLGCGGNAGINFTKSLRLANPNISVYGIDIDKFNLISSNANFKFLITNNSIQSKIDLINSLIIKYDIKAIHAQPDQEVEFLCDNQDKIQTKIFNYSGEDLKKCKDKLYTAQVWKNYFKYRFDSYTLIEVIDNPILFNILKDQNTKIWFRARTGAGSKAALPICDLDTAICWAKYWINRTNLSLDDFILSTFLPGREYAVQTFWLNGNLIHSQARERLVYFFGNIMPSGQSSTPAVARTIKDNTLYQIAHKAIKLINNKPHGIYCIDLKTNIYNSIVPTEINYGRFFTTSDFFAELGINTPHSYISSILDATTEHTIKINTIIDPEYYWIRGLDKNPMLVSDKELNLITHQF